MFRILAVFIFCYNHIYRYGVITFFYFHISLCFDVFYKLAILKGTRSTEIFFGEGKGDTQCSVFGGTDDTGKHKTLCQRIKTTPEKNIHVYS